MRIYIKKGMKFIMLKKISYVILIAIIIAGGVMVVIKGFNKDIPYKDNATIYVSVGKEFSIKEMRDIAKEVFGNQRVLVQVVELYKDMVSFTVEEKSDEELAPKVEELNKKINEKYGLENKVENISIVHSPKVRLRDIISPYIWPVGICTTLVFVYAMIRYRKLGAFRTLGKYIVGVLGIELLYLSLIALTRLPINQLVIPVGLLLYTLAIIIVTVKREIKLEKLDKVEN